MSIIDQIINELKSNPQIQYTVSERSLTVDAGSNDGFDVVFQDDTLQGGDYSVSGGSIWHDHFDNAQDAYDCFISCLTPQSRLKITSRGGKDYMASIEMMQHEEWVPNGTVGLAFFPFWRKKTVRYLQNNLL